MIFRYKAILFDMDGVILDTMPYHFNAWQEIFGSLGIHLEKFDVYKREGERGIVSISEILSDYGKDLNLEDRQNLLKAKERLFKKIARPKLFPAVIPLIGDLKKKGYLLGLVTGTSRDEVEHVLPASLIKAFDVIVAGDEVKRGKPAPEPYLKAIRALKIRANEVIVIENAPYGIESAQQAGAFCIAITTSLPREYLKDADIICDSLEEVRELMLRNSLVVKVVK